MSQQSSQVRDIAWLKNLKLEGAPDFGTRLHGLLSDMLRGQDNLAMQSNGNTQGQPAAPPPINGLKVTGQNGHFHIAITDQNPIYRGIKYYAEYSTTPNFQNPQAIHMGDSRNHSIFLGNGTYYWRAYSAYAASPASQASYHGGAQPQAVSGGGSIGGPAFLPAQGTGTGAPGQGLHGPGPVPFRSDNGVPPPRS